MVNLSFTCHFTVKTANTKTYHVHLSQQVHSFQRHHCYCSLPSHTPLMPNMTLSVQISVVPGWEIAASFLLFTALVSGGIRFLSCLLSIRCVVATRTKKKKVALFQSAQQAKVKTGKERGTKFKIASNA